MHNPDGRVQNLASGGCNGERCPGWLYASNNERGFGVWVPNFWQEYPNELALRQGELSVGLWPERATSHLLSKPLLPAKPEKQSYTRSPVTAGDAASLRSLYRFRKSAA